MAIKNYTTKVPANRSIEQIQSSLISHGATGILLKYEQGTGRIEALQFVMKIKDSNVSFSLPVNWRLFQEVLKQQDVRRWDDDDFAYRVAWRNIRDWVLAQMALFETQMVELPQVFLPFATDSSGETLYQKVAQGGFLLGKGVETNSNVITGSVERQESGEKEIDD